MTLQRRVMLFVLAAAPLVWAAGLLFGASHVRDEINELFDTQQVQLARHVLALLPTEALPVRAPLASPSHSGSTGAAHVGELSIVVWNRQGELLLADREGGLLAYRSEADGFADQAVDGQGWRLYYQRAASGEWLVAVGQLSAEREELLQALLMGQLLPWLLTLPVLLLAMALAVRQALKPVRQLTGDLQRRPAGELTPIPMEELPSDLKPLVQAMNALLGRVQQQVEHERRFTADAAHELRTPLAALQAQWDAARLDPGHAPSAADAKIGEGLRRLGRLVTQLLSLSRLEHLSAPSPQALIDWPRLVQELFSEMLPLAEARRAELECRWPPPGANPVLRHGDSALLATMLRNLLDNALRHSPPHGRVTLRLAEDAIEVIDEGPGVPVGQRQRLGDRFFRLSGQADGGSGLGLSIVRRIAAAHGLVLSWHDGEHADAPGFRVRLSPALAAATAAPDR